MLDCKGYVDTFEPDEGAFIGRVVGLRDVITFEGETYLEVEQAFRDSIDDYLAFCAERGEQPERTFQGRIPLRLTPEVHVAPPGYLRVCPWLFLRVPGYFCYHPERAVFMPRKPQRRGLLYRGPASGAA
jgi:predicted HicB family RNase H-like nuclease